MSTEHTPENARASSAPALPSEPGDDSNGEQTGADEQTASGREQAVSGRERVASGSSAGTDAPSGEHEVWMIQLGELDERMGVEVVEESIEKVITRMPIAGNRQSFGLLHGGAMVALGEATGSWAAVKHASTMGKVCVGVDVNATHHRSSREGYVTAIATPISLGGTLCSHEVVLRDEEGNRLCTVRITNMIRPKP